MGLKLEFLGLCGAGKTTFINALEDKLTGKTHFGLARPIVHKVNHTIIYFIRILILGFLREPVIFFQFLLQKNNWWLIKKLAYRQASIYLRENRSIILVDSGILQPFLSFEIEEKITNSEVPIKSLLNGISLPEAVVVLKVPPSVAKKRYEQRGVNGQGRLIRVNSEEYFNRAEELQKKLIGYCIDRQVKTIEVDSRYEFTEEYLSKKLSEIQNVFKNQRI